jgi:hypothetical protein
MKTVVQASAAALGIVALAFTVACFVTGPSKTPKFLVTGGTGFPVTSAISSSPRTHIAALDTITVGHVIASSETGS